MQLRGGPSAGHLTYCTNIHAGESLGEVIEGLASHLPAIRAEVAGDRPFGVGLRLGHAAAEALDDPAAREMLAGVLRDGNHYVFTINGFPYGRFHGGQVKEGAYRPDWSDPARARYTAQLAGILAWLLPEGLAGSISTVPGTFKPWAADRTEAIAAALVAQVAGLARIEAEFGRRITLALEPEPHCMLETIDETVRFFRDHLYGRAAISALAAQAGLSAAAAERALHRHIGVCYDVCHAAVEFEDPRASIAALRAAGIAIAKVQLSSALRIAAMDEAALGHLRRFDEPTYLHQTVVRDQTGLRRFVDLSPALAAAPRMMGAEWRVHFHVPVFLERMAHFDTTQGFLREVLDLHRAEPVSEHLEVETYTWDVLPQRYRDTDLARAIARELCWVRDRLEPAAAVAGAP